MWLGLFWGGVFFFGGGGDFLPNSHYRNATIDIVILSVTGGWVGGGGEVTCSSSVRCVILYNL